MKSQSGFIFNRFPVSRRRLLEPFGNWFNRTIRHLIRSQEFQPQIESLTMPGIAAEPPMVLMPSRERFWLVSADDSYILQLQDNLFIFNWRYRGEEYPRFEALRERFWDYFGRFRQSLADAGLGAPEIRQIEVAYINWITDRPVEDFMCFARTSVLLEAGLGAPEDQGWAARYLIREDGVPIARLQCQCQPALRAQPPKEGRGTQFGLTVRAPAPPGQIVDDHLMNLVNVARVHIVRAFAALTTEEAQIAWRRI